MANFHYIFHRSFCNNWEHRNTVNQNSGSKSHLLKDADGNERVLPVLEDSSSVIFQCWPRT